MPKFIIKSSEIIYYKNIIEAETEDQALEKNRDLFYNGISQEDGFDGFQVDQIIKE